MDMVNDGKDIRLDTPQAVKEALASGKGLYNPETGEFWWEWNYTGSIANTYVHLDDPNLLAVIDNPDFDLYEDIVGGLNYTGYITDSPETIIQDGEEDVPDVDPRDEVFARIASENGWVVSSPQNVRKAVKAYGENNAMSEFEMQERAEWKQRYIPIDRNGDDALVMHLRTDGSREYIVADGYDEKTGRWSSGSYHESLATAAAKFEGRDISTGEEVICPDFWYRADIESALENAGIEVNDANVNATLKELGLDTGWVNSNFHDRLAEMGNEMIADAVDNIGQNSCGGAAPETFIDKGISLKSEVESMRKASQALSADEESYDVRENVLSPGTSLRNLL